MKIVIDSSVFVSSLTIDEKSSFSSRLFLKKIKPAVIIIPSLVIAETVIVLKKTRSYKHGVYW